MHRIYIVYIYTYQFMIIENNNSHKILSSEKDKQVEEKNEITSFHTKREEVETNDQKGKIICDNSSFYSMIKLYLLNDKIRFLHINRENRTREIDMKIINSMGFHLVRQSKVITCK